VIVTSHSPHIVSVTPPRNLVVFRRGEQATTAGVAADAELAEAEWDDLERYLDATRGELVFAQRVLLVEGFAEAVLVPRVAKDHGVDLDKLGISVCAIYGTHFLTYARYLTALGTPWAILTDGDPTADGESRGERRAQRLLDGLGLSGDEPAGHGIFVGEVTFEPDLVSAHSDNAEAAADALGGFPLSALNSEAVESLRAGNGLDIESFLRVLRAVGKGRFAQRLATSERQLRPPPHLEGALEHLTA